MAMLISPCHSCSLIQIGANKNNPTCTDCQSRIDYVMGIGEMTHSMPLERSNLKIEKKDHAEDIKEQEERIEMAEPKEKKKKKKRFVCQTEGCEADAIKSGYCKKCYDRNRWRKKHGIPIDAPLRDKVKDIDPIDTEKTCNKCGQTKPLSSFAKNPNCTGGHEHTCKRCREDRAKELRHEKARKDGLKRMGMIEDARAEGLKRAAMIEKPVVAYKQLKSEPQTVLSISCDPQSSFIFDFSDYPEVLEYFQAQAKKQLRTAPMQMLWTLIEAAAGGKECLVR